MAYIKPHPIFTDYRMKIGTMEYATGIREVLEEEPQGVIDGKNKIFTLDYLPLPNSVKVYRNGMRLRMGEDKDYIVDGRVIEFHEPPPTGSVLLVDYSYRVSDQQ